MIRTIVSRLALIFVFIATIGVALTGSVQASGTITNGTNQDCGGAFVSSGNTVYSLNPNELTPIANLGLKNPGELMKLVGDAGIGIFIPLPDGTTLFVICS